MALSSAATSVSTASIRRMMLLRLIRCGGGSVDESTPIPADAPTAVSKWRPRTSNWRRSHDMREQASCKVMSLAITDARSEQGAGCWVSMLGRSSPRTHQEPPLAHPGSRIGSGACCFALINDEPPTDPIHDEIPEAYPRIARRLPGHPALQSGEAPPAGAHPQRGGRLR